MLYFLIILYIFYTLYSILIILFYKKEKINNKNILLVIAHPDDEIMFFFPTIKQLNNDNNIHIICLSNGNYDNLGNIREKEIKKICSALKIKTLFIDNFEDNINIFWDTKKIKKYIENHVKKNNIDTIITFDDKGVSYHPNHISCNIGVKNIKGIDLFFLETVYFYRKYLGYFDVLNIDKKDIIFFNLNLLEVIYYMTIYWSQMKWYRIMFLIFSRYSYINNLKKIKLNDE
jgi:N-acetylglucosaminylphosphatidylinositol deacetylase